jgi:ADP-ribose pyrophosphatase YjhB (NUDIX family)
VELIVPPLLTSVRRSPSPPTPPTSVVCVAVATRDGAPTGVPYLLMVRARWTRNGFAILFFGLIGCDSPADTCGEWRRAVRVCTDEELTLIAGGYSAVLAADVAIPTEWRDSARPVDSSAVAAAADLIGQMVETEAERRRRGGTPGTAQLWTVPRGSIDVSSGESAEDALRRELFEETRVDDRNVVSVTPRPLHHNATTVAFDVVFGRRVRPDRREAWSLDNGFEIAEVRWMPVTRLKKMSAAHELASIERRIVADVVAGAARTQQPSRDFGSDWRCRPRMP